MELDATICYLKDEFKIPLEKIKNVENSEKKEEKEDNPPAKKQKMSKERGQNKNRPVFRENFDEKLCRSLLDGKVTDDPTCGRDNCKFSHDIQSYISKKAPDIAEKCPVFTTKGFCMFGISCRFSKHHITDDLKNLNAEKRVTERPNLPHELQFQLRKKTYNYSMADKVLKATEKIIQEQRKVGSCPDEESVVVRPEEKRKIDFRNKLVLSPLTTVGNLPFRRICKEYGADITVGEMACSLPIVNGALQEWALTKRHESEDIFGVQIEGNNSKIVTYAAQVLKDNADIDFIDLNIGCPIELIFKAGGGSALIRRQNVLEQIVRSCSSLLGDMPFTVKTRTGVYANKPVAKELLPKLEKWGASAVTLHGRSREQRYTKSADWNYIEECAAGVQNIPVIGNGDILSYEDYLQVKETAKHVSSVMIGRGALLKPWIFKEIKEGKSYDITSKERLEIIQKFVNYGLNHWGSDTKGVETTRRFLLEWQSFLYRYVPYGILKHPPQKINQRPEFDSYLGRDDMETLMSSPKSSDWVKISEMFLGKTPENFVFVPKHKANAY